MEPESFASIDRMYGSSSLSNLRVRRAQFRVCVEVDSGQPSLSQTSSWVHEPDDLYESINCSDVWFIHAMWTTPVELVAISTPSFLPVEPATISVLQEDPSCVESHRSVVLYMAA